MWAKLFLQLDRWIRPRGKEREGGKLDFPCHGHCSPHAQSQEHKIQVLACQGEKKDLRLCADGADKSQERGLQRCITQRSGPRGRETIVGRWGFSPLCMLQQSWGLV